VSDSRVVPTNSPLAFVEIVDPSRTVPPYCAIASFCREQLILVPNNDPTNDSNKYRNSKKYDHKSCSEVLEIVTHNLTEYFTETHGILNPLLAIRQS
jgi:hypothetical protein